MFNIKIINNLMYKLGYVPFSSLQNYKGKLKHANELKGKLKVELKAKSRELQSTKDKYAAALNAKQTPKLNQNKLQAWAKNVKKDRICFVCSETKDEMTAHHIYPKSLHFTLAYEVSNGVCLCLTCHNKYHKKYKHVEDCNPFTLNEFKEDELSKIKIKELEQEIAELKLKQETISTTNRVKKTLAENIKGRILSRTVHSIK